MGINDINLISRQEKAVIVCSSTPTENENKDPLVDDKAFLDIKWENFSSNYLFSGDVMSTILEVGIAVFLLSMAYLRLPALELNVVGSSTFKQVTWIYVGNRLAIRIYNTYLEYCYFSYPQYRTQPPKEHVLKKCGKELCGRDREQLELLLWHDRLTFITQTLLYYGLYYAVPGFYPVSKARSEYDPLPLRILMLVMNHLVLSFSMYWMHRALHVNPTLWKHIHSIHHWATHPLSRVTYQDHWLDNFGNEIMGAVLAQLLVPLDFEFFIISRILRIMESLEKHSGISCWLNIAHTLQAWFPYAQAPHHHDWHHEGFKSCNYTFSAIGGVWDYMFATRKVGRGKATHAATRCDILADGGNGGRTAARFDNNYLIFVPLFIVPSLIVAKNAYFYQ